MKILFCDVIAPRTFNGISISNSYNISILKNKFIIDIIEKPNSLLYKNIFSIKKSFDNLNVLIKLIIFLIKNKYNYFYLSFSTSFLGSIDVLLRILVFRSLSKGEVIIHVHRGDLHKFSLYYPFMFNLMQSVSSKIILLSETFLFNSLTHNKIFILPNTISELKVNRIKSNREFVKFIFITNYIIEKGIIELLEVFSELIRDNYNVKLFCYGEFSKSISKQKILQYNSDNILINPPIIDEKKYDLLANSDCLILPSHNEGQPLIILEAMYSGTPIISTNVGDIKNMLGDDYPFLISPKDKLALRESVISFLNFAQKNKLSDDLKNRYLKKYSNVIHEKKIFKIFKV